MNLYQQYSHPERSMQIFPNERDAAKHQIVFPCVDEQRQKKKNLTRVEGWLPPSKTQVIVG